VQLTFDHRIGNIFIQAAVDRNRTNQSSNNSDVRGGGATFIDINRVLPNGAANPHFLQPYNDSTFRRYDDARNSDGARVAVGLVKDLGKWGTYTFNVMGGHTRTYNVKLGAYNLSLGQNPDHRRWGASGTGLPRTDTINIRTYWNEPTRPFSMPGSVRYIDPVNGIDKTITPFWALELDRTDSFNDTETKYTYGIAAVTAKFWKKRIVVLGAFRGDDFYSLGRQQLPGGDYSATTWDGVTGVFAPAAPADYASLTYTLKDAAGTVLGPPIPADTRPRDADGNRVAQYANDRFKNDYSPPAIEKRQYTPSIGTVIHITPWLSPYINYAETFNPPSIIQRIDSTFLQPTVAKGVDLGVRLSLLKGRLNLNFLQYRNSEINNAQDHGIQGTINGLLSANAVGDPTPGGRNIRDLPNVPSVMRDIQDREATGREIEITANLTNAWRLTFNVGFAKVYQTNPFQDLKKYLATNDAVLRQIVIDAGGLVSAEGLATLNAAIPINERSPDVNTAVNNYNSLQNSRRNFIDGRRLLQDQPSGNIYSDYSFQSGRLRGLRVGAGWQYRGKQVIGARANETIVNPANPAAAIDDPSVSIYDAVYAPASWSNAVATIGYTWRLADKREVQFNLKIDNVLDQRDPIWAAGITTRPLNGDYTSPARRAVPTVFALRAPRNFNLTTTLKF
jgi:outer membrane receptor protein involved in Fe transport